MKKAILSLAALAAFGLSLQAQTNPNPQHVPDVGSTLPLVGMAGLVLSGLVWRLRRK